MSTRTEIDYTKLVNQIIRNFHQAVLSNDQMTQKYSDVIQLCDLVPDQFNQSVISQLHKGMCYDKFYDSLNAEICYRKALDLCQKFDTEVPGHWEPRIRESLRENLMKQEKIDVLINEFRLSPSELLFCAMKKRKYRVIEKLMDQRANPFEHNALTRALTCDNELMFGDNRIGLYFLSYLTDKKYRFTESITCAYQPSTG
jgi:hypothetical protein